LPGVNGSATPTFPSGKAKQPSDAASEDAAASDVAGAEGVAGGGQHEPAPRPAARASVQASEASEAPVVVTSKAQESAPEVKTDKPVLAPVVPADEKVIGGSAGVPLADAISPYGQRTVLPQIDLLPADTASGARFGLDDDAPLADVAEVPVGGVPRSVIGDVPSGPMIDEYSPAQSAWTPPAPRAALDPLTAPYEDVQVADLRDGRDGDDA
ncbi:MAG: hypothetical protein ABI720_11380, partial [Actinomycetes bacterium]